jgi:hypothetical protein
MYADITREDLSLTEKHALFTAYEEVRDGFFKLKKMWQTGSKKH